MASLVQNRLVQLASGYKVSAVLLAVIVVLAVLLASAGDSSSVTSVGDRVFLTSGGTVQADQGKMVEGRLRSQITVDMSLPLTAAEAVADGWTDPIFCSVGRGRYFQKGPVGEGEPFFLMYNADDELLGMYLFSKSEMPSPWHRWDELKGGGGLTLIDFEHWSLVVFTQDATRACGAGLTGRRNMDGRDRGR